MWLFTRDGFFSVVCARQGDGAHGRSVDLSKVMVRARSHRHLEALKARHAQHLAACDIVEFPGSDYACRLFVDKATWTTVVATWPTISTTTTSRLPSDGTGHPLTAPPKRRCTTSGR